MTIFWILAAGLAVLAVLFVVAPLLTDRQDKAADAPDESALNLALRREQLAELDADLADGKLEREQYDAARRDLEREALHDLETGAAPARNSAAPARVGPLAAKATMVGLAVAVPLTGLLLYLALGTAEIIPRLEAAATGQGAAPAGHGGGADGLPPLEVLVARLEERLQQTPEDAEGWMMLGRTYYAMQDAARAEEAVAKAQALAPEDPQILLVYAEIIAANNNNSLEGRPAELISQALALDPANTTARWLAGMAAFQRGQYNAAVTAWKKVLGQLDPASEDAKELSGLIAEAEVRAGVPPTTGAAPMPETGATAGAEAGPEPAPAPAPAPEPGAAPAPEQTPGATVAAAPAAAATTAPEDTPAPPAAIEVRVELDPALAAQAPPGATVFVFARAAGGPPMPLAAARATVADLPLTLRLDDSMAMLPEMRLSAFPEVVVGARVSLAGEATPRPGDLEGETGPVPSSGAAPVAVRIARVRP